MTEQICWDEINEGDAITPLSKVGTTQMLVRWAGASGDFNPLHYDHSLTKSVGVGTPIIHGALKRQWLIQMLTDWMGEYGFLKKLQRCLIRKIFFNLKENFKNASHLYSKNIQKALRQFGLSRTISRRQKA